MRQRGRAPQVGALAAGRGRLRVEQGKGRKDRYTWLGPRLVAELRRYWQRYRPTPPGLFPQQSKPEPTALETAQRRYYVAKERAGITTAGGIPGLRQACTTHLLAGGADLPTRQRLLGHARVTTTRH